MVRVKIYWDTPEIQIEGHANSAPHGQDLVCCAVSTLMETLSLYLEQMMKEGRLQDLKNDRESGRVYLCPQATPWTAEELFIVIKMAATGFKALANQYSEYVTFEEE